VRPEDDPELREAMRNFFYQRLRATLSLTDEQMEAVVPRLEELEGKRDEIRRQRREVTQGLHRGLKGGAGDEELQQLLNRFDALTDEEMTLASGAFTEIDPNLTVRQRVQLRFFLRQFQERMQRRIEEIRRGRGPEGRRRPPQGDGGQWNRP
jgi:hypothetical protein